MASLDFTGRHLRRRVEKENPLPTATEPSPSLSPVEQMLALDQQDRFQWAADVLARCHHDKNTGCIEWMGSRNGHHSAKGRFAGGYGKISFCGKTAYVHRLMAAVFHPDMRHDLVVLHQCDNRICCNPDHLKPGTQLENMAEMVARGRHRNGAKGSLVAAEDFTTKSSLGGLSKKWAFS